MEICSAPRWPYLIRPVRSGCVGDIVGQGTTTLSADTLNPGDWYYISIDDDYLAGRFTACISDQPTFDYWEGAIELNHDEGCSADGAYTNLAATPDMLPGSCWGSLIHLKTYGLNSRLLHPTLLRN